MEVKINREIRDYAEAVYFGLSMRQFVFSFLGIVMAVFLYFLLKDTGIGTEGVSWICILGAAPFIVLGFFRYNGMRAEEFLIVLLKDRVLEPQKIRYRCTTIYGEEEKHRALKVEFLLKAKRRDKRMKPDR